MVILLVIALALAGWLCNQYILPRKASGILERTGTQGGLIVHLGCGNGKLTARLHRGNGFVVHGLTHQGEKIQKLRKRIAREGKYGDVSVMECPENHLPYTDNFVNLLVSDDPGNISEEEMIRVLVPGGSALIRTGSSREQIKKPVPGETDEWHHFLHGADNNPVADDRLVGPPKHMQWVAGPKWSKHHEKFPPTVSNMVSANGRVFYIEERTPPAYFGIQTSFWLTARDAYNGVLLWEAPMADWFYEKWHEDMEFWASGPDDYRRRLAAMDGHVYVTPGSEQPAMALDASTGEELLTYGTGHPYTEILVTGDMLYTATRDEGDDHYMITAFNRMTAEEVWKKKGGSGIAVDRNRIFYVTRGNVIGALDALTGKALWANDPTSRIDPSFRFRSREGRKEHFAFQGPIRCGEGIALFNTGNSASVVAVSQETGNYLWGFMNRARGAWWRSVNAFIIDGLVWVTDRNENAEDIAHATLTLGLDPQTGEVVRIVPCGQIWNAGHHDRCYPSKATCDYMIYSRRGAEFLDLDNGEVAINDWVRGTCTYGVMPCNGLLYAPPHSCRCYSETMLRGILSLAPERNTFDRLLTADPKNSLEKGPAYPFEPGREEETTYHGEWPTYRHDPFRSGTAGTSLSTELSRVWSRVTGTRLSAPVIAGNILYVASVDEHSIRAFDAGSGKPLWEFTAGGRIDSPPSIYKGLAIFGSADGSVYALRARDGRLVWRFRAAPSDLMMGSYGQPESAWPVHGSVLVEDGVVYFAAGRSSFLDNGIYVYGLDAVTGEKICSRHLHGPFTDAGFSRENPNPGYVIPGALPDILVSDGEHIYMRHLKFNPSLTGMTNMQPNYYEADERTGEEWGGDHKYWDNLMEVPRHALQNTPSTFYRSYYQNYPGKRLYSTTGLLDDSWHVRSYWSVGQVAAQYIVFDQETGYATRAYPHAARWEMHRAGQGFDLFSAELESDPDADTIFAHPVEAFTWHRKIPVRAKAMVKAGETLWIAGHPDPATPDSALAAVRGRLNGMLWAVSAETGDKKSGYRFESPAVFEGMAVANEKLYLVCRDGSVHCLAGE